jgi:two-component system nitrogen regulation response regulator GlnG/two-component system response regulator HydG
MFGAEDADGLVGESPAIWELRSRIQFAAGRTAHVLITGASGTGKELVANAIHRRSPRGRRSIVSRNAATLPASLLDAELFGNAPNYPNAGMAERPGIIGQADGSSLFLDELGELPSDLHAHLLRVLDAGEYQRLGDARAQKSDFRFMAATNRGATSLKQDLAARLALNVHVPGLEQRREDIPLLARHIVARIMRADPELERSFAEKPKADSRASTSGLRISAELSNALVCHQYVTHVRELESLLYCSAQTSPAGVLECTSEVQRLLRVAEPVREPATISRAQLHEALARHGGVKEHAWRELGLGSRYALLRLMRKLGET